jgi:diacylglycerol kinase family enzyme
MNLKHTLFVVSKLSNIKRGYRNFVKFLKSESIDTNNIVYGAEELGTIDLSFYDTVFLAGGDGFIRLCLNTVSKKDLYSKNFSILPFGTGNAFYYNITKNKTKKVDMNRLLKYPRIHRRKLLTTNPVSEISLFSVSIGFERDAIKFYRDNEHNKRKPYVYSGIISALRANKLEVIYDTDGTQHRDKLFNFSVYSGEFVGYRARVASDIATDKINYYTDGSVWSYLPNRKLFSPRALRTCDRLRFIGKYNFQIDGDYIDNIENLEVQLSEEVSFVI